MDIIDILNESYEEISNPPPPLAYCRCCLRDTSTSSKNLASEYFSNGERVVYADMLKKTFGLKISRDKDLTQAICESCIKRLIDATEFKKQVQECDANLKKTFPFGSNGERPKRKCSMKERKINIDDCVGFDNDEDDDDFRFLENVCETPKIMPQIEPRIETQLKMINKKLNLPTPLKSLLDSSVKRREKNHLKMSSCLKARKVGNKIIYYRIKPISPSSSTHSRLKAETVGNKTTYYLTKENSYEIDEKNEPLDDESNEKETNKSKKQIPAKFTIKSEYAEIHDNGKKILLYSTAYPFWLKKPYVCLKCVYCKEADIDFTDLKGHMEEKHKDFDPAKAFQHMNDRVQIKVDCSDLKCRICNKPFDSLKITATHLKEDHGIDMNLSIDFGLIPYKFEKDKVLTCAICFEEFKNFNCLNRHMASHYLTFMCDQCGKSYSSKGALKTHQMFSHSDKPLCWHCKTSFDSRAEMNTHYKNTYECWNYTCKLCGEKFARGTQKQNHMISMHGKEYGLQCTACKEKFSKRDHLDIHFARYHSSTSPRCQVCDKVFVTAKLLVEHMSSHTGATPYQCQQCSKQYATRKALAQHTKINHRHHFSCNECNKHFGCKSSLLNHNATHH